MLEKEGRESGGGERKEWKSGGVGERWVRIGRGGREDLQPSYINSCVAPQRSLLALPHSPHARVLVCNHAAVRVTREIFLHAFI